MISIYATAILVALGLAAGFKPPQVIGGSQAKPCFFSPSVYSRSLQKWNGVATEYTIDIHKPHRDVVSVALKHKLMEQRFIENHPIASHTSQAFEEAECFVRDFYDHRIDTSQGPFEPHRSRLPVILDSGCGTGRSSLWLAKKYPDVPVLGVDRSVVRLSRSTARECRGISAQVTGVDINLSSTGHNTVMEEKGGSSCEARTGRKVEEIAPKNLLLIRADLVDFWLLAQRRGEWEVREHYLLYPNPHPKKSQLRGRWHGHPVFPTILRLGGRITVRSNWETFLQEMCLAVLAIQGDVPSATETELGRGTILRAGKGTEATMPNYISSAHAGPKPFLTDEPVSNFEAKFMRVGEQVFELILEPQSAGGNYKS
ncbi:unnamed protein product [Choristocarpus tenellus]